MVVLTVWNYMCEVKGQDRLICCLLFIFCLRIIMCLYIKPEHMNDILQPLPHITPDLFWERRELWDVSTAACGSRRWHAVDWFTLFIKYQRSVSKNMHTGVLLTAWCLYACVMTSYLAVVFRAPRWWLQGMFRDAGDYLPPPVRPFLPLSFSLLTEGISCEQMLAGSLMHNDCSDVFVWVGRPLSVHCSRCEIIGWGFPRTSHK